ncbi:MAG: hypothetical protein M3Y82_12265 [Verrucomicrobiota bacterium]|nr:hypothetical protein [Verrucomicrobiota bacterium]
MELSVAAQDRDKEKRTVAQKALSNLTHWNIQPFALKSIDADIAEKFSERLRKKICCRLKK